MAESLIHSTQGRIVRLTFSKPDRRNSISIDLLSRLDDAISAVSSDPNVRVVVIAGNGPVFSSGHDLSEMVDISAEAYKSLFELCSRVMLGLRRLEQPVIARVHG